MSGVLISFVQQPSALVCFAALLKHFCYQACPPGLVAGTETGAGIAVEIFVEQDEVLPVWVAAEPLRVPVERPFSLGITQKNSRQPA
jgi:hypothetical protein